MPKVLLASYVSKKSYFHKLHPLTKLAMTFIAIVLAFSVKSFTHNLIISALMIPLAYFSKVSWEVLKPLRYFAVILVVLFGIQSFFYPFHETPLLELPFGFTVWYEGVMYAAFISARLLVMLLYGYWFVLTTHPGDLVSELKERGMPFWMGYIVITTLQLIPRIQLQTETIIEAQKSRGLETKGSIIKRFKSYLPLLGPLFMGSVQQAVERTMALEARAFSSKIPKTNFRDKRFRRRDFWWIGLTAIMAVAGVAASWLL